MSVRILSAVALSGALFSVNAAAHYTDFSSGTNGWGVFFGNDSGLGDFERPTGGNPGEHLEFIMVDTFGVNLHNDSNPAVLGDYARFGTVTLGVDVKAESIQYFGSEVERHVVVELLDLNAPGSDYPWTSVWYDLGTISAAQNAWQTFSVTIADPTATALPAGWGGYGAEDPVTFEPILPADRTFASVLASVDEVRFTTFVPGYFYGFTNYDLRYDNVNVGAGPVPEPTGLAAAALLGVLTRRRR